MADPFGKDSTRPDAQHSAAPNSDLTDLSAARTDSVRQKAIVPVGSDDYGSIQPAGSSNRSSDFQASDPPAAGSSDGPAARPSDTVDTHSDRPPVRSYGTGNRSSASLHTTDNRATPGDFPSVRPLPLIETAPAAAIDQRRTTASTAPSATTPASDAKAPPAGPSAAISANTRTQAYTALSAAVSASATEQVYTARSAADPMAVSGPLPNGRMVPAPSSDPRTIDSSSSDAPVARSERQSVPPRTGAAYEGIERRRGRRVLLRCASEQPGHTQRELNAVPMVENGSSSPSLWIEPSLITASDGELLATEPDGAALHPAQSDAARDPPRAPPNQGTDDESQVAGGERVEPTSEDQARGAVAGGERDSRAQSGIHRAEPVYEFDAVVADAYVKGQGNAVWRPPASYASTGARTDVRSSISRWTLSALITASLVGVGVYVGSGMRAASSAETTGASRTGAGPSLPRSGLIGSERESPPEQTAPTAALHVETIRIETVPEGAELMHRGAVIANTPADIERPAFEQLYLLRLEGYQPQLVRIGPRNLGKIRVTLKPAGIVKQDHPP